MKIVSIGGGPAGLYFGILMKLADRAHEVTVFERNRPDDTFGFGVVFSDATLSNLADADDITYAEIRRSFAHWDDIDTHIGGQVITSTGHGFCGLERKELLEILRHRCEALGVELRFETEVSDVEQYRDADLVLGADGVASLVRDTYADAFEPDIDLRPNRFVWLGTTFPFKAFTFYFKQSEHGLFRVHAYRYSEPRSTFIVECRGDTFERTGLAEDDEDGTIAYLQEVFAEELDGHELIKNRSIWRSFPTVRNARWHQENVVLVGDAAHTAHFSIGSGTKLAMEDAIALRDALVDSDSVTAALERYEAGRRPGVESLQRAAQMSLEWFENTERYMNLSPLQFTFSLLTRSLRVSHENLRVRDPDLVARVDRELAGTDDPPLPRQVPLSVGGLELRSRVVRTWTGEPDGEDVGLYVVDSGTRGALEQPIAQIHELGAKAAVRLVATHDVASTYVERAAAAVAAGADLVQLDVSLQTPLGRTDRGEVAAKVLEAVVAELGDRVAVCVRISGTSWVPGDYDESDAVAVAKKLRDAGASMLAVTAAPVLPGAVPRTGRLYQVPFADRVRNELGIVAIAEGEIRSVDDIDSVIASGRADLFQVVQAG